MQILHVEDDQEWFERVMRARLENAGANEVFHTISKTAAVTMLQERHIDYVILDLAIPLDDPRTSPSIAHGAALAVQMRQDFPGIPVLILTGQSSEDAAQELEEYDSFAFFWDGTRRNLVKTRKKRQLDLALDLVEQASQALTRLEEFELDYQDQVSRDLTHIRKRVVKLFGVCRGATAAKIQSIGDGLSDAAVLRVNLLDANANETFRALAKIGPTYLIEKEIANYNNHVTRLPVASFPSYIEQYFCGCGSEKGVFFQLATEYRRNYFRVLLESDDRAAELVGRIRALLGNWHTARTTRQTTVQNIRVQLCNDEKFQRVQERFPDIDWNGFEERPLQVNISIQHGDLHGGNVLVSEDNQPLLIDYTDVGERPCCLDPITMELSPYFHPSIRENYEPSADLAANWFDLDNYLGCANSPQTARELRDWATENWYLTREGLSVTYAYCVRQLGYPGTNEEFAIQLIEAAIERFE